MYGIQGSWNVMAKLITSTLFGLLMPWSYFLVVTVGPVQSYDPSGNETVGSSGLFGFIEFNGILDSLIIYTEAVIVGALVVFIICTVHEMIAKKCAT